MSAYNHNKKRNSGLVYEFLVRQVTRSMLEQDQKGCEKTLRILRRYFSEGQPLAKERELFETIRSSRGLSATAARRVLAQVKAHFGKMDRRLLEIKKSNLIKEINYAFGKEFFSAHRIPEYRLLASIQMFLDGPGPALRESVQGIQLEEGLVKFLCSKESVRQPQQPEKEVDNLVCALAAQKFQEKYGRVLTRDQKSLLERYMLSTVSGDESAKLKSFLGQELDRISGLLSKAHSLKEVREDEVMKARLAEAHGHLANEVRKMNTEGTIQELLLYYRLLEELTSNE